MTPILSGARGGILASLAMSLFQAGGMKLFPAPTPEGGPDEWTPHYITKSALKAFLKDEPDPDWVKSLSALSHLGYGAFWGALYGLWSGNKNKNIARGMAFGLGVWAIGYAGWVPALGILNPPHREHRNREVRLLLAHLVYGAALAAFYNPNSSPEEESL
ncbi:MAG: DUF1440 domain-containing protein [Armatimonadetes bacterium]|nr:DUF1440 domain-containing protein [Armatimonadota bacterium]